MFILVILFVLEFGFLEDLILCLEFELMRVLNFYVLLVNSDSLCDYGGLFLFY